MLKTILQRTAALFVLIFAIIGQGYADITLPHVLGDNMVLQRGQPVPVWGQATPGEKVTVHFASQNQTTQADSAGHWSVTLPAMPASAQPQEMTITGANTITLKNILVGEVWLCSGQSNMEYPMAPGPSYGTSAASHEILRLEYSAAHDPQLRIFKVEKVLSSPDVTTTGWKESGPETLPVFSAVAYYFGRKLRHELGVPVGLIQSAWGGTRIEPWTPAEAYKALPDFASETSVMPLTIDSVSPGKNYRSMIAPLQPFALRGVIWYQGESNVINNDGPRYAPKMQALMTSWRNAWNAPNMPFYYAQLAPDSYTRRHDPKPHTSEDLPLVWEAQSVTLRLPHTGMAGTIDLVDNINNIHPGDKWDVGERLALWALKNDYGQRTLVCSGPLFNKAVFEGNKVRVYFDSTGTGLTSRDSKPLTEFTVAGADGVFVPADAAIDGQTVIVTSASVPKPTAVRFAWSETAQPNLCNKEGLPAIPFRSDGPLSVRH